LGAALGAADGAASFEVAVGGVPGFGADVEGAGATAGAAEADGCAGAPDPTAFDSAAVSTCSAVAKNRPFSLLESPEVCPV
jgi:hypothetical protein